MNFLKRFESTKILHLLEQEIYQLEESTMEDYSKVLGSMNFLMESSIKNHENANKDFNLKIMKYFESRKKMHLYKIKKEKLEDIL